MAGNRPYNNQVNKNSNRRSNNTSRRRNNYNKEKKELEATTRIRIDNDRLNDSDSLDTSFLEGRIDKRVKNTKKSKKVKEKILTERKKSKINYKLIKRIIIILLILCILGVLVILLVNSNLFNKKNEVEKPKVQVKEEIVKVVDDNYLFVGDYNTVGLDLEDVYKHVVVVGNRKNNCQDLLDNMKEDIYDYNPSHVFISLGINDLVNGRSEEEVLEDLESIISGIQNNRSLSKIYIESLYPINEDVEDYDIDRMNDINNKDIIEFNKKIEELTKKMNVNYLDMFTELSEDDVLKDIYTDDGVTLNDTGYKRVIKVINRVVDDMNEENND